MPKPKETPKTFQLRLPTSARIQAAELAQRESVSLNQFIVQAVAERIARMELRPSGKPGRTQSHADQAPNGHP